MPTKRYAADTTVTVARSQEEVRGILRKLGVERSALMDDPEGSIVWFQLNGRAYRITAPRDASERNPDKRERSDWRAIVLLLKAKAVGIHQGITTVEREFLADTVMADGSTLIDHADKLIENHYANGGPPRLTFSGG